jgi:hypothetical protein
VKTDFACELHGHHNDEKIETAEYSVHTVRDAITAPRPGFFTVCIAIAMYLVVNRESNLGSSDVRDKLKRRKSFENKSAKKKEGSEMVSS